MIIDAFEGKNFLSFESAGRITIREKKTHTILLKYPGTKMENKEICTLDLELGDGPSSWMFE